MDEGKFLAALQHIVGAIHQLAVSSASGLPHVVAMANSAQQLINDLMPQPEPADPPMPEDLSSAPEPTSGPALGLESAPLNEVPPPAIAPEPPPAWTPPAPPAQGETAG